MWLAERVLMIQVFVPVILHSRTNGSGSRAHWSVISAAARDARAFTTAAWIRAGKPTWKGPATVTMTAYVGRLWDGDNLAAALKSYRDQAVKDVLGSDDGPRSGHAFPPPEQAVRPKHERGVLIQISPLPLGTGEGVADGRA